MTELDCLKIQLAMVTIDLDSYTRELVPICLIYMLNNKQRELINKIKDYGKDKQYFAIAE
jgi:hypothetical protein